MFILQVIEALGKHKVDYAVVGGFAVALHGAGRFGHRAHVFKT